MYKIKRKGLLFLATVVFAALVTAVALFALPATNVFAEDEDTTVETTATTREASDYNSLIDAINDSAEGDIVLLTSDISIDLGGNILLFDGTSVSMTIDLNGHTLETTTTGDTCYYFSGRIYDGNNSWSTESVSYTITIENGTLKGTSVSFIAENVYSASLILDNVEIDYTSTSTGGNPIALVTASGSNIGLNRVVLNSNAGGIEVAGGNATLTDCEFNVTPPEGRTGFGYTAVAVSMGGAVTVESGDYTALYGAYVYSSGGTMNLNGGTFSGSTAAVRADLNTTTYPNGSVNLNIAGGEFDGNFNITSAADKTDVSVSGGVFSVAINEDYIADGSVWYNTEDGYKVATVAEATADGVAVIDGKQGYTSQEDAITVGGIVATVGTNGYKTLQEAIGEAGYGATVKLLGDVAEDIVIDTDQKITLDLNGCTLTNVSSHTITNNGELTITGNGTVDNITHAKAAVYNTAGATAYLINGSYTRSAEAGVSSSNNGGNSYYVILNRGYMEIGADGADNDTVTVEADGKYSSLVENGWQTPSQNTTAAGSNLVIYCGSFSGGINTIKNDDYGTATIEGGYFYNTAQYVVQNWNNLTINGGTYEAPDNYTAVFNSNDTATSEGKLVINDGEFTGYNAIWSQGDSTVDIYGGSFTATNFALAAAGNSLATVYGGDFEGSLATSYSYNNISIESTTATFSALPAYYCFAEGYSVIQQEDGSYSAQNVAYVARVGNRGYLTLDEAIAAAPEGGTVVLLNDCETVNSLTIQKSLDLDLNGHKIKSTVVGSAGAVAIEGVTLTVNGGTDGEWYSNGFLFYPKDGGSIVLNGGTFTADNGYAVLSSNNTTGVGNFEINGSTLIAGSKDNIYGNAIYMPSPDTLTINGGEIYGSILVRMGNINISGGTFYATIKDLDNIEGQYGYAYNGNNWLGSALTLYAGSYKSDTEYGNALNVNITGGTFINEYTGTEKQFANAIQVYVAGRYAQSASINISDNVNFQVTNTLGKNVAVTNVVTLLGLEGDTTWDTNTVIPVYNDMPVLLINGSDYSYYATLQEAIGKAEYGATVKLLDNVATDSVTIAETQSITLDLNGYSITRKDGNIVNALITVEETAELVVEDSVGGGRIYSANFNKPDDDATYAGFGILSEGSLTINGGEVEGYYGLYITAGTVDISGGTVSGTQRGIQFSGGKIAISDGTVSGNYAVWMSTADGVLEISGGKVYGTTGGVMQFGGTVEISQNAEIISDGFYAIYSQSELGNTVLNVTGGTVTAASQAQKGMGIYVRGYKAEYSATVNVSGGTVSGYMDGIRIAANVSPLSGDETLDDKSAHLATVTISGDAVVKAIGEYGVDGYTGVGSGVAILGKGANLIVNGGEIIGTDYAIVGNGSQGTAEHDGGTYIEINGGTITSGDHVIYHPQLGTLVINGGYLEGATGIEMRSGNLTVTGGTIVATGDPFGEEANSSGTTLYGAAVGVSQHTTKNELNINITGGTLKATENGYALYEVTLQSNPQIEKISISVTDGTFEGTVSSENISEFISGGTYTVLPDESYIANGNLVYSEDGSYVVSDEDTAVEEGIVAAIGSVGYTTLTEALANAAYSEEGTKITLLTDVTESNITIGNSQNIILDLNGCTLTNTAGSHTITNNGTLTITGNGTVDNVTHAKGALVNYGTATLNGGMFTRSKEDGVAGSNSWYVILNQGTMTINENVTVYTAEGVSNYSSLIVNGLEGNKSYPLPEGADSATITINGGTFNGGIATLKNDYYGIANVYGGTFGGAGSISVQNWGELEITDGVFEQEVTAYTQGTSYTKGTTNVSGGTFNGGIGAYEYVNGGSRDYLVYDKENVAISGGSFSIVPNSSYIAEGYAVGEYDEETQLYGVVGFDISKYEAVTDNGVYFETLQQAISNANYGATVKLLKDVNADIVIAEAQKITLDLNGHTLTNVSGHTITNYGILTVVDSATGGTVDNETASCAAIYNNVGGSVTIDGATISRTAADYYVIVNHGDMTIETATVTSCSTSSSMIENGWYTASDNTAETPANLTINGGKFTGGLNTLKNDEWGNATINGGEFGGAAQYVVENCNVMVINGGTFDATGANSYAVYIRSYSSTSSVGSMEIKGGTFIASAYERVVYKYSGSISISGGDYSKAPTYSYLADGYSTVAKTDSEGTVYYGVEEGELPVRVDNVFYTSISDAIGAIATSGDIYVLADLTETQVITVPAGKTITLDLGGHTLTTASIKTTTTIKGSIVVQGTLSVSNGSIISNYDQCVVIYVNGGELLITGKLTVDRTVAAYSSSYYMINVEYGKFTVSGSGNVFGKTAQEQFVLTTKINYLIRQRESQIVLGGNAEYYGLTHIVQTYSSSISSATSLTITGGTFHEATGKNLYNTPDSALFTVTVTGGTFDRLIATSDMPLNTVCVANADGTYTVKAAATGVTNIVSGSSDNEFAWSSIANGYGYIPDGDIYTVVSADAYIAWAKAQVTERKELLLAKYNYSEGAIDQIASYEQTAFDAITAVVEDEDLFASDEGKAIIERAMYTAIAEMNGVPTVNAELNAAKTEAENTLKLYALVKGVDVEEDWLNAINNAADLGEVETALSDGLTEVNKAVAAQELEEAIENAIVEVKIYAAAKNVVYSDTLVAEIKDAETLDGVSAALEAAKATIDNAVATVGGEIYTSVQSAINAANDGETVTLIADVTESITVAAGQSITLDLNGYTLTNKAGSHTITNNGTLTITGNGTVDNITHAKGALVNYGTATLNGGTFTRSKEDGVAGSNSWYVILNQGTMTINENVTVYTAESVSNYSSLIVNGLEGNKTYPLPEGADSATITINGGTFNGGIATLKNDYYGIANVYGGTFGGAGSISVQNWGELEITDGVFEQEVTAYTQGTSYTKGTTNVSGGTFNGGIGAYEFVNGNVLDYLVYDKENVDISGGTFVYEPDSSYLAEDYALIVEDGVYGVVSVESDEYAQYIVAVKAAAVAEVEAYVAESGLTDYDVDTTAIDEATNVEEIAEAVAEAKTAIDKEVAEAEAEAKAAQELAEAKANALLETKFYAATNGVEYSEGWETSINNATADNLNSVVESITTAIDTAVADAEAEAAAQALEQAKTNALLETKLYAAVKGVEYSEEWEEKINGATADELNGVVESITAAIDSEADKAAQEKAEQEAAQALAEAIDAAKTEVKLYAATNGIDYTEEMENCFEGATAETLATAKEKAIALVDVAIKAAAEEAEAATLKQARADAVVEVRLYAAENGVEYSDTLVEDINSATTVEAVNTALLAAKAEIDKAAEEAAEQEAIDKAKAELEQAKADALVVVKLYAAANGVEYSADWETSINEATADNLNGIVDTITSAIDSAAKEAADKEAADKAAAEQEAAAQALEQAKINALLETKLYAAIKGVEYLDSYATSINNATDKTGIDNAVTAVKGFIDEAAQDVGSTLPSEDKVSADDITAAKAELDKWLNDYIDLLLGNGGEAAVSGGKSTASAETSGTSELRANLLKVYSEENADKIIGYYNEAVAAIESAETKTDIQIALLTFRSNVLAVDKLAAESTGADNTIVYVWLAILTVLLVAVVVLLLVKRNGKNGGDGESVAAENETNNENTSTSAVPAEAEETSEEEPVEETTEEVVPEEEPVEEVTEEVPEEEPVEEVTEEEVSEEEPVEEVAEEEVPVVSQVIGEDEDGDLQEDEEADGEEDDSEEDEADDEEAIADDSEGEEEILTISLNEDGTADVHEENGVADWRSVKRPYKPFVERITEASAETRAYYSEIKNEFCSYKKVNSRFSKKCESYRRSRKLLAKVSIVGKTMRVYLALNPADYAVNVYHQKDMAEKKAYAEVPMMIKVKSQRGVGKAKRLIAALMDSVGAEKDEKYERRDYAKELRDQNKG